MVPVPKEMFKKWMKMDENGSSMFIPCPFTVIMTEHSKHVRHRTLKIKTLEKGQLDIVVEAVLQTQ
jgi:hypothetical protein